MTLSNNSNLEIYVYVCIKGNISCKDHAKSVIGIEENI